MVGENSRREGWSFQSKPIETWVTLERFLYLSWRLKFFCKMGVKWLLPRAFQDLNIMLYIKLQSLWHRHGGDWKRFSDLCPTPTPHCDTLALSSLIWKTGWIISRKTFIFQLRSRNAKWTWKTQSFHGYYFLAFSLSLSLPPSTLLLCPAWLWGPECHFSLPLVMWRPWAGVPLPYWGQRKWGEVLLSHLVWWAGTPNAFVFFPRETVL